MQSKSVGSGGPSAAPVGPVHPVEFPKRWSQLYSIFDVKAQVYDAPFPSVNNATAIRLFSELVNHKQSRVGKNPEDFVLYSVGQYCEEDCTLMSTDRVRLTQGHEVLVSSQQ